jgi:hypothetical protein
MFKILRLLKRNRQFSFVKDRGMPCSDIQRFIPYSVSSYSSEPGVTGMGTNCGQQDNPITLFNN